MNYRINRFTNSIYKYVNLDLNDLIFGTFPPMKYEDIYKEMINRTDDILQ